MSGARVNLNFRARLESRDWLDALADEADQDRSAVIRVALAVARRHETDVRQALALPPMPRSTP